MNLLSIPPSPLFQVGIPGTTRRKQGTGKTGVREYFICGNLSNPSYPCTSYKVAQGCEILKTTEFTLAQGYETFKTIEFIFAQGCETLKTVGFILSQGCETLNRSEKRLAQAAQPSKQLK